MRNFFKCLFKDLQKRKHYLITTYSYHSGRQFMSILKLFLVQCWEMVNILVNKLCSSILRLHNVLPVLNYTCVDLLKLQSAGHWSKKKICWTHHIFRKSLFWCRHWRAELVLKNFSYRAIQVGVGGLGGWGAEWRRVIEEL